MRGEWELTGHTYLWMFGIYGSAVVLEKVHEMIRPWPWWLRGTLWMTVFWLIEYLSGWTIRALIGVCPWDYSGMPGSIQGIITLSYAPVWFTLGLAFEQFHDLLTAEKQRPESH